MWLHYNMLNARPNQYLLRIDNTKQHLDTKLSTRSVTSGYELNHASMKTNAPSFFTFFAFVAHLHLPERPRRTFS